MLISNIVIILILPIITVYANIGQNSFKGSFKGSDRVMQIAKRLNARDGKIDDGTTMSLLTAINKLHGLTKGTHTFEARCELYTDLLGQSNIQTDEGLKELIEGKPTNIDDISETLDLKSKLRADLNFETLKKLRILTAWFDSEFNEFQIEMKDVKSEILSCIVFYGERHLRSVNSVSDFIDGSLKVINPIVFEANNIPRKLEYHTEKMDKLNEKIPKILARRSPWLEIMKKLVVISINYRHSLPQDIMQYLTKNEHLELLDFMDKTSKKLDKLENDCIKLESESEDLKKKSKYPNRLLRTFILAANNIDWLPRKAVGSIHREDRWALIQRHLMKFDNLSRLDPEWSSKTKLIDRNAFAALVNSCTPLSTFFGQHLHSPAYSDKFSIDEAQWMVGRLYHYSLGCMMPKVDETTTLHQRRWLVKSISSKLSDWSMDRMGDENLSHEKKRVILANLARIH